MEFPGGRPGVGQGQERASDAQVAACLSRVACHRGPASAWTWGPLLSSGRFSGGSGRERACDGKRARSPSSRRGRWRREGQGCDRGAGVPSIWPKDAGAKAVPKPPEPGPAGGEGAPTGASVPRSFQLGSSSGFLPRTRGSEPRPETVPRRGPRPGVGGAALRPRAFRPLPRPPAVSPAVAVPSLTTGLSLQDPQQPVTPWWITMKF